MKNAVAVILKVMNEIVARMGKTGYDTLPELPPRQAFPIHISHLSPERFRNPALFVSGKVLPQSHGSENKNSWFRTIKSEILLLVDCAAKKFLNEVSNILHPNGGFHVVTAMPAKKENIIKYYCGSHGTRT